MSALFVIEIFKVFRTFFLKIFTLILLFFKGFIVLLVYNVGISFFLLFEVAVLFRVFLFFSAKIIIQTTGHTN
jgi:hypothetical protein